MAALKNPALRSLLVVDALDAVIEWHERGLVPLGPVLTSDSRCRLVHGDFFSLATTPQIGFDSTAPTRQFHAVLLDIDHSPHNVLHPQNAGFYSIAGLTQLAAHLHPGGSFAMWSDDPPDDDFLETLRAVFINVKSHVVSFHNPILERDSASTVYVARKNRAAN